jgi:hypothetical protein
MKSSTSSSSSSSSKSAHVNQQNTTQLSASKRMRLEVHDESSDLPLLISFPGGTPEYGINEFDIHASRYASSKLSHSKTKLKAVLDHLTFEGNDIGDNSSKRDCYTFAVGIIPKNDDSTLHVYSCQHVYALRPQSKPFIPKTEANRLSTIQRKESLTNEFGSKKKKAQVRASKANQISAENISGVEDLKQNLIENTTSLSEEQVLSAEEIIKRSKARRSRGK